MKKLAEQAGDCTGQQVSVEKAADKTVQNNDAEHVKNDNNKLFATIVRRCCSKEGLASKRSWSPIPAAAIASRPSDVSLPSKQGSHRDNRTCRTPYTLRAALKARINKSLSDISSPCEQGTLQEPQSHYTLREALNTCPKPLLIYTPRAQLS